MRVIALFVSAIAFASQANAAYWFDGAWRCSANGRSAQMYWGPSQQSNAPHPVGLPYSGRLVYSNGPTVFLQLAAYSASALTMRTKEGNLWFLSQVDGNPKQLKGSMTDTSATRFPMLCWRPGEPAPVSITRLPPVPPASPGQSPNCPLLVGTIHTGVGRRVPANREWCDSGIALNKGARVIISANGLWSNVGPPQFGPAGIGEKYPGTIVGSVDLGALVGKLGNKVFAIGSSFDGPAPATGSLWLSMNDVPGTFGDNQGHVNVTVTIVQ